jgi:hypothetical protein
MSFDVAVGMSGAELNTAAAAVYHALYPKVFTGSQKFDYQNIRYTVGIDVKAPPQLDLSTATDQAFTLSLPTAALSMSNGASTTLELELDARCQVVSEAGKLSFVPRDVTATLKQPNPSPVTKYFVDNYVVPAVKDMLTKLFSGITIPPIQVENIPLSAPSVGVVNGYVIATVNLAASGPPPPPDRSFPWPNAPFFALLGPNLIQQLAVIAASSATNRFSDSGSGGDHWAGYNWSYSLSLTNPHASIQGAGVRLSFTLQGGVSAGVEVVYIPISLGFDAHAAPDPGASAVLSIQGNQLVLVVTSVAAFTIYVIPGTVPTWIVGWTITAIINAVTLSLTPVITTFLRNIRLDSYQIPTYSVSVEGTTLTLTPANLTTTTAGGLIALTGNAVITSG